MQQAIVNEKLPIIKSDVEGIVKEVSVIIVNDEESRSAASEVTLTGIWGTDCAPSIKTGILRECAISIMFFTGFTVPNTFETCATETKRVFSFTNSV